VFFDINTLIMSRRHRCTSEFNPGTCVVVIVAVPNLKET
jgi:hypothetical protein